MTPSYKGTQARTGTNRLSSLPSLTDQHLPQDSAGGLCLCPSSHEWSVGGALGPHAVELGQCAWSVGGPSQGGHGVWALTGDGLQHPRPPVRAGLHLLDV